VDNPVNQEKEVNEDQLGPKDRKVHKVLKAPEEKKVVLVKEVQMEHQEGMEREV